MRKKIETRKKTLGTYFNTKPCKRGHFERYVIGKKCVECGILRYQKNLENVTLKAAKRYQENKEDISKKQHTERRLNPEKTMWYRAKDRAKKKSFEFNLDESDIVIPKYCPVFPEIEFNCNGGFQGTLDNSPSLDRVDNSKGYVKGNIRVISTRANRLKSDATCDELKRLYEYTKSLQEKTEWY